MLVYFLVTSLQTIDRLLILAILLVYSGLLFRIVHNLSHKSDEIQLSLGLVDSFEYLLCQ